MFVGGEKEKSVTRYNQLTFAQEILKLKDGEKKKRFRSQFAENALLSSEPWTEKELKILINILYSHNKSISKEMLRKIGAENPQSLARVLILDLLKIKPRKEVKKSLKREEKKPIIARNPPFFIKVALIGDEGVGKQTIQYNMIGRGFRTEHLMTIGADFATTDYEMEFYKEIRKFTFQVWALASQNYFTTVRQRFFRGSVAGLIIFDISNENSFMGITKWIEELWRNCGRGIIPIAIIGNKSDLRHINPQNYPLVARERITHYCEAISNKIGFPVPYIEMSAIYKVGRDKMLSFLAKAALYLYRVSEFFPDQETEILITDHIFEK